MCDLHHHRISPDFLAAHIHGRGLEPRCVLFFFRGRGGGRMADGTYRKESAAPLNPCQPLTIDIVRSVNTEIVGAFYLED